MFSCFDFQYNETMKTIESVQNKEIKEVCKLHTKKGRDGSNQFLVEGEHLIQEAYEAHLLDRIFLSENVELDLDVEQVLCSQAVLNKISLQKSNASCIGLCHKPDRKVVSCDRTLLLDEVQDPGNMGTLIRSALSFGFNAIFYSKGCVDPYNPKVVQASQGALFKVHIEEAEMVSTIRKLQEDGFLVLGTALRSYSHFLHEIEFPKKTAFVLGNEGSGLSNRVIGVCDDCVKIDMDRFESLNVGVAGSICMYSCFIQGR